MLLDELFGRRERLTSDLRCASVDARKQLLLLIDLDYQKMGDKGRIAVQAKGLYEFVRRHLLEANPLSGRPRENAPEFDVAPGTPEARRLPLNCSEHGYIGVKNQTKKPGDFAPGSRAAWFQRLQHQALFAPLPLRASITTAFTALTPIPSCFFATARP
ncbi:hypothetical protein ABIE53_001010 [Burkholderia sp. OAS925]